LAWDWGRELNLAAPASEYLLLNEFSIHSQIATRVTTSVRQLHAAKAEFDREIAELQRQLAEAKHELKMLHALDELARWQPTDTTPN
jgi:hypothetical protein